jgi:hypothetical protein
MSVIITIQGTPIEFPSSGESPNWAPAVIEFAEATGQALLSAVGPYDISPQIFNLNSDVNTNLDITNLNFLTAAVRAGYINYSVIRSTSSSFTVSESGSIIVLYDGTAWALTRDYLSDARCSFNITPTGQLQISTNKISSNFNSTNVNTTTDTITINNHGYVNGDAITFTTTGTLPSYTSGTLLPATPYYVTQSSTNEFKISTSVGGSVIDFTNGGTGTHTINGIYTFGNVTFSAKALLQA